MKIQGKHPDIPIWSDQFLEITKMPFSDIKKCLDIIAKQNNLCLHKRPGFAKAMKLLVISVAYN